MGTLDRRLGQSRLTLPSGGGQLDILVENTGRINFSLALRGERKGITKQVTLAGETLKGWEIFPLPMTDVGKLAFKRGQCNGPCFYRGSLKAERPADTFLDTNAFGKGEVWLNGRALGRVWNIGPQKTLYAPGPWLKQGENEVVVLDLEGESGRTLRGLETPVLDGLSSK